MCEEEEELQGLRVLVKVVVLPRTGVSLDTHVFGSARDFAQIWKQRGFFFFFFFYIL